MGAPEPRMKAPLATRKVGQAKTHVMVGDVCFGGEKVVLIGGPCAVESLDQITETALQVQKAGGSMLRGGAWKPRTSPYDFQGLGAEGLELLVLEAARKG